MRKAEAGSPIRGLRPLKMQGNFRMLAGPSPDTDEELTRKVLELIETEAGVKAAVSGPKSGQP